MQLPLLHQIHPTEPEISLTQQRAQLSASLFARNTMLGYGYDFSLFRTWAQKSCRSALPATSETVSCYLTDMLAQNKKITTVRRRCCAIIHEHRIHGYCSPVTPEIYFQLEVAQRARAEKPRQMRPISLAELRGISAALGAQSGPAAIRDRAILVLGWASALRRASIAELLLSDIEFAPQGLILTVRREKQDQAGKGRLIGIPRGENPETCPVRTLSAWLEIRGAAAGALFHRLRPAHSPGIPLDGERIAIIVKRRGALIGLDPHTIGAHSLRSGFITEAGLRGIGEWIIAAHTGHRTMAVLRRYFRRTDVWRANPCAAIGL